MAVEAMLAGEWSAKETGEKVVEALKASTPEGEGGDIVFLHLPAGFRGFHGSQADGFTEVRALLGQQIPAVGLLLEAFDFLALSPLSGAGTVCSTTCSTGSAGGSAGNSSCTGSGYFAANFVPSSLLGRAFTASLRLRLAAVMFTS